MIKRRTIQLLVALIGAAGVLLLPAGKAGAASYTNACRNSVQTTNWDQVDVTLTATASPGSGKSVTLGNIQQTLAVPGAIFVAGYNLGLLSEGPNSIPATLHSVIDAVNTVQGSQTTNNDDTTISTTITDPDHAPGTGDESATPGTATATFADETWTAAATGKVGFHEHNDNAITGIAGGGIIAVAHLSGGVINVQFHCTSGTVAGSSPGVPSFSNAPEFASAKVEDPRCQGLRKKLRKAKKAHNKTKVKKIRKQMRKLGC
jgi:hypothetical protein